MFTGLELESFFETLRKNPPSYYKRERMTAHASLSVTECYWVSMSVDECRWVLLSVTECYWVLLRTSRNNDKNTAFEKDRRTLSETHATHSKHTHYPRKGIIYPLCSEENKGIPPVQWQIADRLHNIEGAKGGSRRRSYTYRVSHFFIKTTGEHSGGRSRGWTCMYSK